MERRPGATALELGATTAAGLRSRAGATVHRAAAAVTNEAAVGVERSASYQTTAARHIPCGIWSKVIATARDDRVIAANGVSDRCRDQIQASKHRY